MKSLFLRRACVGLAVSASVASFVPVLSPAVSAAPSAPDKPVAIAGDRKATIAVAPSTGGSGTVTYTVTAVEDNAKTCSFTSTASQAICTITGLTNGTSYTFTAVASDSTGSSSASSASDAVTPALADPALETTVGSSRRLSSLTEGHASFIDAAGEFVYVGTDESSGTDNEVLKFRLSDMTLEDSVVVSNSGNSFWGAATDGTHGYFSTSSGVYKVQLSDMTVAGSMFVDGTHQVPGRNMAVIGGSLYRVGGQGYVEKINPSTMQRVGSFRISGDPTLVAAFEGGGDLFAIEYFVRSGAIKVFKVDLSAASFDNTAVSSVTLDTATTGLAAALTQGYNGVSDSTHAYILANAGWNTRATIVKLSLSDLSFVGAEELSATETRPADIAIDRTLGRIYVANDMPGSVSRVDSASLTQLAGPGTPTYNSYGATYEFNAIVAKAGSDQFWAVGTAGEPGIWLARFGLGGPEISTPGAVSNLQAQSSGRGQLTVSWTAPTSSGGFPITGYKVTSSDSFYGTYTALSGCASSLTSTDTSCSLTDAGGQYYVKVAALNAVGEGAAPSNPTQAYVPPVQPSVSPSSLTVTGTVGTAITPTTALTFTNFSSTPTVTMNNIPAGLSLDSSTGVLSGTPTANRSGFGDLLVSNGSQSASVSVEFNISGGSGGGGNSSTPAPPPSVTELDDASASATLTADGVVVTFTGIPASGLEAVEVQVGPTSVNLRESLTIDSWFFGDGPPAYTPGELPAVVDGSFSVTLPSIATIDVSTAPATRGTQAFIDNADYHLLFGVYGDSWEYSTFAQGDPVVVSRGSDSASSSGSSAPTTTSPASSVPASSVPASGGSGGGTTAQAPSLVTSGNQEQLTSSAGTAKILINGELVEVELVQAPEELRRTAAAARTFAEVRALQALAQDMVAAVQAVLGEGVTLPITIQNTSTGATITGVVTDPVTGEPMAVPVEDVLLIVNQSIALMVGGADGAGDPANIAFDGVLEFGEGGYVAVLAYGLTPGAAGEVVVMSTPRLLDTFAVGSDGGVAVQSQIPTDLDPGDHTVVVAIDGQSASVGFRVLAPGILPSTGGDQTPLPWAVLVLAAGAFAVLTATRRRTTI